ncbi:MAG: serine/threonine protein kinase [Coriobacteriales bacterium]|jgi:serine/threonine protein kinase|nr:serine/threonine protein kinase [Coriobacteriales bacterium]
MTGPNNSTNGGFAGGSLSGHPASSPAKPNIASDSQEFLAFYQQALDAGVAQTAMPDWVTHLYHFESCLKYREDKQVYLVRDKRTGGQAILRIMNVDEPRARRSQRDQEYSILSGLNFAGVPKVYGSFVEGRQSYLVREYFPGRPLDAILAQGALDTASIVAFARQLCTILRYLHSCVPPVIHRDIKPGNIIVLPNGRLGLTDFGIARVYKEESDSDTSYEGTLLYAPPEQFGFSQSTPLSDIYALGIVMLCMATGSPIRQGIEERVRDKQLRGIIQRCIAFDPQDRFQSVDQLADRLDRMSGRPVSSTKSPSNPANWLNQSGKANKNRRQPRIALRVALLAAALVLVVGLSFTIYSVVKNPPSFLVELGILKPAEDPGGGSTGGWGTGGAQNTPLSSYPIGSPGNPHSARSYHLGDSLLAGEDIGNLGGNINNGGFAVQSDDAIYIAQADGIYRLGLSAESYEQIIQSQDAHALNFYNGLLYFADDIGIYSYNPQRDELKLLYEHPVDYIYLMQDRLFFSSYAEDLYLYELDLSSGKKTLASASEVYYRNLVLGFQYFTTSPEGSTIMSGYANDSSNGSRFSILDSGGATWLSYYARGLYFSDNTNQVLAGCDYLGDNYCILAYGTCSNVVACPYGVFYISPVTGQLSVFRFSDGTTHTVVGFGVSDFCLAGEWVFYHTSDDSELHMVHFDGTENQLFGE